MRTPYQTLKAWSACNRALWWIRQRERNGQPTDWYSLWRACPRGDWLVWLLNCVPRGGSGLAFRAARAGFVARDHRGTEGAFADYAKQHHGWDWYEAQEHADAVLSDAVAPHPLMAEALHEGAKLVRRTVAWREVKPLLMEASS